MNTSVFDAPRHRNDTASPARISTTLLLRSWLIVAALVAMTVTVHFGTPSTLLHDDPELARLLRGMALIKATIALAAMGVLWWRFGRPVPRVAATVYVIGAALMAGATLAIWQLTSLLPAAVIFHVGLFALLWTALRGDEHPGRNDAFPARLRR